MNETALEVAAVKIFHLPSVRALLENGAKVTERVVLKAVPLSRPLMELGSQTRESIESQYEDCGRNVGCFGVCES